MRHPVLRGVCGYVGVCVCVWVHVCVCVRAHKVPELFQWLSNGNFSASLTLYN